MTPTHPATDPSAPLAALPAPARTGAGLPAIAVLAAVGAFAGTFLGPTFISDQAVYAAGPEAVYAELDGQLLTQLGAAVLYATAALLFAVGHGLGAHLERLAPARAGAASAIRQLLQLAAGTVVVGAILKSVLASGLPGGVDADFYTQVDVAVSYTIATQVQYAAFVPALGAMAVAAWLALRHRVLPRWFGALSALMVLGVAGVTIAVNLPWSAGLVTPLWLLALSAVLLVQRRRA